MKLKEFCEYEWESYLSKFILGTPLVKSLNLLPDIKLQFHSGDHMLEQQPLVSTILQPTWHKPISYHFVDFIDKLLIKLNLVLASNAPTT
jgi:hypothetical protein